MLILSFLPATATANSAEPPALIILVTNPPKDLSIVLVSNTDHPKTRVRRVAWERYYGFYKRDLSTSSEYTFKVTANGETFECKPSVPLQDYNNIFTLDIPNRKLTPGTYPLRTELLVSIRVLLTLLIEGLVFWHYGFRRKGSWLIFLVINLITQGVLNIGLNSGGSPMESYLIISLFMGEFFVFVTEMIAFPLLINEYRKSHSFSYAFIANLISLLAGGFIITILPV
jgi:hypothetical protein